MNASQTQQVTVESQPVEHRRGAATSSADTRLAAVLDGKPAADEIPLAAWWFVAESLRHSVLLRRSIEGIALLSAAELRMVTSRARTAAEAALDELSDDWAATGAMAEPWLLSSLSPYPSALRTTIRDLARLIVSHRCTSIDTLTAALTVHLDAVTAAEATASTR